MRPSFVVCDKEKYSFVTCMVNWNLLNLENCEQLSLQVFCPETVGSGTQIKNVNVCPLCFELKANSLSELR